MLLINSFENENYMNFDTWLTFDWLFLLYMLIVRVVDKFISIRRSTVPKYEEDMLKFFNCWNVDRPQQQEIIQKHIY